MGGVIEDEERGVKLWSCGVMSKIRSEPINDWSVLVAS